MTRHGSLSSYPRRAYPYTGRINPGGEISQTALLNVIPAEQSRIKPGVSFAFQSGPFDATAIIIDVPPDVTCHVDVNGGRVLSVTDGSGLQTALPYGDAAAGTKTTIQTIRVTGRNNGSTARNVRAWVVPA